MEKFTVVIEETVVQEFEVFANNVKEAISLAETTYQNGTFVLEPGEVHYRQMKIINPTANSSEWIEF